jgi:uncharacterized protein
MRRVGGHADSVEQPWTAVRETHISTVALVGDRAFKFLKPLRTEFLDQSTAALRRAACQQELELNRRLAPDVYLGIGEVREGAEVTDTFLVMRRMPDERRLSALIGTAEFDDAVRDVARDIASFHSRQPASALAAEVASAPAVASLWTSSLDQMANNTQDASDLDRLGVVRRLAGRYVSGRAALFQHRIDRGMARDGHGDLLAEDIFVLDDGVRILDCLAFDERLRCGDVLLDVAFLAMDLERLAGPAIAARWLDWYAEFAGEHHPSSLADHYIAYRALVRSKVGALRAAQGDPAAAIEARAHLDQCLRHLVAAAPLLVLVGGSPGTGKTTVAEHLATAQGLVLLSSDPLRKELAGIDPETRGAERINEGIYSPAQTRALYGELLDRAERLLSLGESVVLDASWTAAAVRAGARRVAEATSAELVEIRCVAPPEVVRERIVRRSATGRGASDATVEVAEHLSLTADPWPEAVEFSTHMSLTAMRSAAGELSAHLRQRAVGHL